MKRYGILIVILLLAFILRFWDLSSLPPTLSPNEALIKNAGENLSNLLTSPSPGYSLLSALFLKIFHGSNLVLRFPSALAGVLLVLVGFFLSKGLLKTQKLALFISFFIAISPWSIQFSRIASGDNIALFLNALAIYLFIKGLKNSLYFALAILLFSLSLLFSLESVFFVPPLVFCLVVIFKTEIKQRKYLNIYLSLLGLFFILQIGQFLMNINPSQIWGEVRDITGRYLNYFSFKMLSIEGDKINKIPDLGPIYLFSPILILPGITYLIKQGLNQTKLVILSLILLSPLSAVFSTELDISKTMNMILPLTIFEGCGAYYLTEIAKAKIKWIIYLLIIFIIGVNFILFLDSYFIHFPIEYFGK